MGAVKPIDKQINSYLVQLNDRQKKAVLTVVKTFADKQPVYDHWEDEAFIKELDRRTTEYESGKARVYTLLEMEAGARKAFKRRKKTRK